MLLLNLILASSLLVIGGCYCKGDVLTLEKDMDDESMAYIHMDSSNTDHDDDDHVVSLFINGSWTAMIPLQKNGYATINLLQPGTFEVCDLGRNVTMCSSPLTVSWDVATANLHHLIATIFYTEN